MKQSSDKCHRKSFEVNFFLTTKVTEEMIVNEFDVNYILVTSRLFCHCFKRENISSCQVGNDRNENLPYTANAAVLDTFIGVSSALKVVDHCES